jgi:hypothetical protein
MDISIIKILGIIENNYTKQNTKADEYYEKWLNAKNDTDRSCARNGHLSSVSRMAMLSELRDEIKKEFELKGVC